VVPGEVSRGFSRMHRRHTPGSLAMRGELAAHTPQDPMSPPAGRTGVTGFARYPTSIRNSGPERYFDRLTRRLKTQTG
jgi:hypothetical protein